MFEKFRRKKKVQVLGTREAYALWAPAYPPTAHNPLMKLEEQTLLPLLPIVTGNLCLDLGCGSGRYLLELEQRGARAMGVDLSPEMLKQASAHCKAPLITGSLLRLPFPDAIFDLVICSLTVGHIPELPAFTSEAARILKPSGCLLYSDFHPFLALQGMERTFRDPDGNLCAVEHHIHMYSNHQHALKDAGFTITQIIEPTGKTLDPGLSSDCPLVIVIRAQKS